MTRGGEMKMKMRGEMKKGGGGKGEFGWVGLDWTALDCIRLH